MKGEWERIKFEHREGEREKLETEKKNLRGERRKEDETRFFIFFSFWTIYAAIIIIFPSFSFLNNSLSSLLSFSFNGSNPVGRKKMKDEKEGEERWRGREIEEGTFEEERHDDILATESNSSPSPLQCLLSFPYLLFSFISILSFPFLVFFPPLVYLFKERQVEQVKREREREGDPSTTGSSMLTQPDQYYFDSYKKAMDIIVIIINCTLIQSHFPHSFHSSIILLLSLLSLRERESLSLFLSLNVCQRLDWKEWEVRDGREVITIHWMGHS